MNIGNIQKIMRYPVKSFTGENVLKAQIMSYGIYGDRSHAFVDKTNKDKHLTITQFPEMVTYKAQFLGEESLDAFPKIKVSASDGAQYNWEDQALRKRLEKETNRTLETITYSTTHVPFPAIEVDNILIISTKALSELSSSYGEPIDERRFRGNIVYDLQDSGIKEQDLIGKRLKVGLEVIIEITKYCERCVIITVDPNTGKRQPKLLKQIVKERNNQFGFYARVIQTGTIYVGDQITIL
ncbi:MOSC domain-containing protein [Niallia sp.]|uniref:MOSC domain-containing protein n=1 Tax=Niallia sp. TaxID=2837523 RepID=UPI0028962E5A|nr:MOSC domain-containing protein [Niallia sp.]